MAYREPLTEEEVKRLAEDIYRGLVFTTMHIQNPDDVVRIFMPLMLLDDDQRKAINDYNPGMIYEYMDNACPISINGMPTFASFRFINQEDAKRVNEMYIRIKGSVDKL